MNLMKLKPTVCIVLIVETMDVISTLIGIRYFGLVEINPIASFLGMYGFFVFKTMAVLAVAGMLQVKNLGKWFEWFMAGLLTLPVLWNITLMIIKAMLVTSNQWIG